MRIIIIMCMCTKTTILCYTLTIIISLSKRWFIILGRYFHFGLIFKKKCGITVRSPSIFFKFLHVKSYFYFKTWGKLILQIWGWKQMKIHSEIKSPLELMGQKVNSKSWRLQEQSSLSDRWRYDTLLLQKHMGMGIKLKLAEPYFLLWCHLVRRKTINFSSFRQSIFHKEICSGSM